jgi:hypothetical protein
MTTNNNEFDYDYDEYNYNDSHKNICKCKDLKLIQIVAYNYIKKFTKNEHLRFVFAAYAMNPSNRSMTCDELNEIFPHKNKLDKIL